jgi:Zn-finger nucleic acid-binding protein
VTREPMRCPNCNSRFVEVERSEILIDACPECRGIWLDRGELDKILVRERSMSAGDPDEDFFAEVEGRTRSSSSGSTERQQYEDEPRGKRRKRGFFEDLLDFD